MLCATDPGFPAVSKIETLQLRFSKFEAALVVVKYAKFTPCRIIESAAGTQGFDSSSHSYELLACVALIDEPIENVLL